MADDSKRAKGADGEAAPKSREDTLFEILTELTEVSGDAVTCIQSLVEYCTASHAEANFTKDQIVNVLTALEDEGRVIVNEDVIYMA